ncbi:MAG: nucleoid occlusion factor SlmA [bacterium]
MAARGNRKQDILEALAKELEKHPGDKITTAAIARAVGVTEAALYRHFPSKTRMFEGLIQFAEDALFTRFNQIVEEEKGTENRCRLMLYLLLRFAEQNPGILSVLLGQAVVGEHERLYDRTRTLFERIAAQFKQVLREVTIRQDVSLRVSPEEAAGFFLTYAEGKMHGFLRQRFSESPMGSWDRDWQILQQGVFAD